MGLFKAYKTDTNIEKAGVIYTPDSSTMLTLARAGGGNTKFASVLDAKAKPFRRQIDAGTLDPKMDKMMMAEVYAATIVKNWETIVDGKAVQGIEADPDAAEGTYTHPIDKNGMVPFNSKNVVATFIALPDLFQDVQREAQRVANYLDEDRVADAKN